MILESQSIRLRLVQESDAEFILSLRLDKNINKFLSPVSQNLKSQIDWINKYKDDEKAGKQFYFIIERLNGIPCGTVRIYEINSESFCWGSWILNHSKTLNSALESALLIYEFGFETLSLKYSRFTVAKNNKSVISFHKKLGALQVDEDEENIHFIATKEVILEKKQLLTKKFHGNKIS